MSRKALLLGLIGCLTPLACQTERGGDVALSARWASIGGNQNRSAIVLGCHRLPL